VGVAGFDVKLWIAQGFGLGRVPIAPGTFGSLIGLLWFALLISLGHWLLFSFGIIAGFFVSVWLCGAGEKILQQKDPGSVVLDEITAMPLCFVGWIIILVSDEGHWPKLEDFFGARSWFLSVGIFAVFRLFDVAKPWPVKQSQSLPGGWGITVDDFLAAIYVSIVTGVIWLAKGWLSHSS